MVFSRLFHAIKTKIFRRSKTTSTMKDKERPPKKKLKKRGDDDGDTGYDGSKDTPDGERLEAGDLPPDPRPANEAAAGSSAPTRKNAFQELMTAKPRPSEESSTPKSRPKARESRPTFYDNATKIEYNPREIRDGLGKFILEPKKYPARGREGVIQFDDDFVLIWDTYPKGKLHLLLLSRKPHIAHAHPTEAFDDPEFLESVKAKAKEVRKLAAGELQRLFINDSATEIARRKYIEKLEARAAEDPDVEFDAEMLEAPPGRDWEKEIRMGIHCGPSMNHFHIHVISPDMHSIRVKTKKHYQTFNTSFFVSLEEFPLSEDDPRRPHGSSMKDVLSASCKCWRCGAVIGGREGGGMQGLTAHMAMEFDEWKRI